ncbi:MAG TPA: hypothetical protein EYO01_04285 [Phycisphaerales bacterium]|nr:hypothetical protein [Phycisphaerales bacterium]HIB00722.1 hypothetical protein [Phycisphaerales bacterium]HIB49888.1 hypothetical protein [Phycisphaerales bacterium]HIN83478.1 hypothetical protein [Phycisphaerales bacterium]HIO20404.1 hypothetical protein [Phycisphaerales bacterium]
MTDRIVQSECNDSRLDSLSKELMRQAMQCINATGEFRLVLSESTLLDDFYARLMCDPEMRAMPWDKIQVWFFGDTTEEDSIELAIAAHSGIAEENVRGKLIDESFDCCVLSCVDVVDLDASPCNDCKAYLIVSHSNDLSNWSHDGVAHWFCL